MVDKQEGTAVVEPTLHPAVELLLARMKSNPDEFYPKGRRWQKLISEYSGYFTEAEHVAINGGQREIAVDAFHVAVMNELLRDPEEDKFSAVSAGIAMPNSYYQNTSVGLNTATGNIATGINANAAAGLNSLSALNAQQARGLTQTEYLRSQMNSVQQAYLNTTPSPTPTPTPTTGTPRKNWLGGLF